MNKQKRTKLLASLSLGALLALCGGTFAACGETGTSSVSGSDSTPGSSSEKASYEVTFDTQGGPAVTSQTIEEGGKVEEPEQPVWPKHRFIGWYKESACENAWNFETDTVTGALTLYALWEETAGEIEWEVGEMPVIYSDMALYNKTRATEDVFTSMLSDVVVATEDGEPLQTIVGDIGGLVRDETTGLIEAKEYTILYQAQNSMGDVIEKEVPLTVLDAQKTNYYVEFKSARGGKGMEEAVGTRIRVAEDMYFESTAEGELPEALKNPHAEGKIRDYDDPFLLKNVSQAAMTVNLQDTAATYLVFEAGGKVVWGYEGVMAYVVDETHMFPERDEVPTTFEIPAGGYALVVGYTQTGNWYASSVDGKAVAAGDYWGSTDIANMWDIDGRQMTYMDGMYRYGNMVRVTQNGEVVTDAYVNQLPYIMKGYETYKAVVNSQLTKEMLLAGVEFYDDNGTFAPDTLVAADKIDIDQASLDTVNMSAAGDYTVKYIVTDATDASMKFEFVRAVNVFLPTNYVQFGAQIYDNPKFLYNQDVTDGERASSISAYDKSYTGKVPEGLGWVYNVVIDKTTGALIKFADWSYIYTVVDGSISKVDTTDPGTGKTTTKEFFNALGDNELLLVFHQGSGFRNWFPNASASEKAFLTDAAAFSATKFVIKDMAGINIPAQS